MQHRRRPAAIALAAGLTWPSYRLVALAHVGETVIRRTFCGLLRTSCGLAALGDEGAAAGDDLDQALASEHPHGLARGQPRHFKPLHELSLRRYRAAGRVNAALDLTAQDRRDLQVDRRLALMIDRHAVKLPGQRGRQTVLSDSSPIYPARRSVGSPNIKRPRPALPHQAGA